jgi:DNA-binding response OmpR family regulator
MKRILLVEDTAHLSEEIADILRLEGYMVKIAASAMHALELLPKASPDLIITDITMPRMDGFELIKQVRSMESFKSIPIIILSAKTSEMDRIRGKEVGADAFIVKPCKAHELIASIDSLLK